VDIVFIIPDGTPAIIFSFFAKYVSGKVKLDEDATDFKWVTVKEAQSLDFISQIHLIFMNYGGKEEGFGLMLRRGRRQN